MLSASMARENKEKLISLYDDISETLEQYNEKIALLNKIKMNQEDLQKQTSNEEQTNQKSGQL